MREMNDWAINKCWQHALNEFKHGRFMIVPPEVTSYDEVMARIDTALNMGRRVRLENEAYEKEYKL